MSPTRASEAPNRSKSALDGMCGDVPLIWYDPFIPPLSVSRITCTVPRDLPPPAPTVAPTAASGTPSPSISPMPATDVPKESPPATDGLPSAPSMLWVLFAVPSALSSTTYAAPVLLCFPEAPAAMSGIPSPSMSPMPATDDPKALPCCLPLVPSGFTISTVRFTVPSALSSMTYADPVRAFLAGAPATMSGIPSPSMSPMPATENPNWISPRSCAGAGMLAPRLLAVPSALSITTCTAPALLDLPGDPTAMSGIPSLFMSPMPATALPSWSPAATPLTATDDAALAVPSALSITTCTAPALLDLLGDPTAMSGTPSPSTSPMPADARPNWSPGDTRGSAAPPPVILEAVRVYASLYARACEPPDSSTRPCVPGVRASITSSPAPPCHWNVSLPPSEAGCRPPSLTKPTSRPICVSPSPTTSRAPAGASNRTVHSSPTSLYDCWFSTAMPDSACAAEPAAARTHSASAAAGTPSLQETGIMSPSHDAPERPAFLVRYPAPGRR